MAEYIIDASVVIDYLDVDKSILSLAASKLGRIWISVLTLQKIRQLGRPDAEKMGLSVLEPSPEQLREVKTPSRLKEDDQVTIILARDSGYICITNDKRMHIRCREWQVPSLWGLDLMLELVRTGSLSRTRAEKLGRAIQEINAYLTPQILQQYLAELNSI